MSFEINPKTMQALNLSTNLIKPIEQSTINFSIWEVYDKYDKNNNDELSSSELSSLVKVIKQYNGDVKQLAKVWGVGEEKARNVINKTSGDILASELYDVLNYNLLVGVPDVNKAHTLLEQINEDNVAEVFSYYQNVIQSKKSFFNDKILRTTAPGASLFTHLAQNIHFNEPYIEAVDHIAETLKKASKKAGVDITVLWQEWESSKESGKINTLPLEEIANRLKMDYLQEVLIEKKEIEVEAQNNELEQSKTGKKTVIPTRITKNQTAKLKNLEPNIDIDSQKGNDVLGDVESKATGNNEKILTALTNILQDPTMAEKINAAFKKEGDVFSITFPNHNGEITLTENEATQFLLQRDKGVIGDGDMNALVIAILNSLDNTKFEITSKTTIEEIEKHINNLFNPRVPKK
ncbi:hypothetical protein IJD34_07530 [bacterium]|nr:hypothetical protein [bacterium]